MFSDGATFFVPLKVKEESLGSLNDCAELVGLNGRMKNLSAKPYLLITSGGLGSVNCVSQWLQSWTKVFCLRKSHWNWEERDANSSLILLIKDNWEKLHAPKMQGSPPETPRERTWHVFSVLLNSVSTTKPDYSEAWDWVQRVKGCFCFCANCGGFKRKGVPETFSVQDLCVLKRGALLPSVCECRMATPALPSPDEKAFKIVNECGPFCSSLMIPKITEDRRQTSLIKMIATNEQRNR